MRGAPQTIGDTQTGPCNPEKKSGHTAVFCLIQGMIRSGPGSRKWVGLGRG